MYSKEDALDFLNLFRLNESTTDGIWAHVETTPQAAISLLDSFQTVDDHFARSVPEVGESEQEESDTKSDNESTGGPHADEVHILDF